MKRNYLHYTVFVITVFFALMVVFCQAAFASVKFYDAATGFQIPEITDENEVYAVFDVQDEVNSGAKVFATGYLGNRLKGVQDLEFDLDSVGVQVRTSEFDVADADRIELFAWESFDTLKPLLRTERALNRRTNNLLQSNFKVKLPNTDKYLYRVGNKNSVALKSLFEKIEGASIDSQAVRVLVCSFDGSAEVKGEITYDYTNWENTQIDFDGTGLVRVVIRDKENQLATGVYLEVVDAKNITTATGSNGTDVVFLNDVQISKGAAVTYENCFVYGNGFTFDARGGLTKYVSSQGWGIINLSNGATLDNLVIVGDEYPDYGAYSDNDYNTAAVASLGGIIQNCHISHCAAPIMTRGSTTVMDSTLYGGTVANMIIKAGVNTLKNITTANYKYDGRSLVGMGIVIHSDADETSKLVIDGTLKQYNFICETDISNNPGEYESAMFKAMFSDDCSDYHFAASPNRYVNTGIISMVNTFDSNDITDKASTGYKGSAVTVSGFNGYVYTQPNDIGSINNGYDEETDTHKATIQGDYIPIFEFDLGDQEISYDGDDDSRYMYGDETGIKALYQDGDSALTLDLTKIATVSKYEGIEYTVSAGCKDSGEQELAAVNGVVTLSTSGEYTLEFSVEDNIFYGPDGNALNKTVLRTYTVPLSLSVKAADIKDAEVTLSQTTLEGSYETVNYTDYKLKLEFLKCISITDYDSAGNGTKVDLTANISGATFSVPSRTDGNVWEGASVITITYTDGRVLTVNLSDFEGSSPGTKTASVVTNDGVYFITEGALNNKPTEEANKCTCTITSVAFKGNNGATATNDTDVNVSWPLGSSGGGCVTSDTLVTLADGSQKWIDEVGESDVLKVWDFVDGKYAYVPSAVVRNHGYDNNTVITLKFSDGTVTKAVNAHGYFDADLNKFVLINDETAESYIGHRFIKESGNEYTTVVLEACKAEKEYTEAYSILSAYHYNFITDRMFSLTSSVEGLDYFMPFEVGDDLTFDKKKMENDISAYGFYTYEDLSHCLTEEEFTALNAGQIKVSVGKGIITREQFMKVIEAEVNGNLYRAGIQ